MGPPNFLLGVWELSQVVAQDKPKAKCLISKIVAQQVSDVHNSINSSKAAIWIMMLFLVSQTNH